MSRMLRRQMLTMIDLLDQATRSLQSGLTAPHLNETEIQGLFSDCSDKAIGIRKELEAIYGGGIPGVQKLEDYCGSLYQITQTLDNSVNCRELLEEINAQVKQIRELVGEQIPDRMEAVFFLFKASMWDSLESVWMAAEEDEGCDAYVVPIPYYGRGLDGALTVYHYEGDEMPDYVPVTCYENYDVAIRKPDLVFINNPYGQCSYAASVPPRFYIRELKNHADRLIYIPNFVLDEIAPDNREAVKGMSHFCTVPAVLYADKVIVQSENMRQIYINVLSEQYGEETRKEWENKILGLGSPKYDSKQIIMANTPKLPQAWLNRIRKPDGGRKKVILYNTSISMLLRSEDLMLKKMKRVFRVFLEAKDDITLLWHSHPLTEAAMSAMRPRLLEEYRKLVEEYKSEGWGIYDDSQELDRASALCDAYYGDYSRLAQMCREAGKPVMIQNVDIT